jgi:hypothetical protein
LSKRMELSSYSVLHAGHLPTASLAAARSMSWCQHHAHIWYPQVQGLNLLSVASSSEQHRGHSPSSSSEVTAFGFNRGGGGGAARGFEPKGRGAGTLRNVDIERVVSATLSTQHRHASGGLVREARRTQTRAPPDPECRGKIRGQAGYHGESRWSSSSVWVSATTPHRPSRPRVYTPRAVRRTRHSPEPATGKTPPSARLPTAADGKNTARK